MTQSDLDLVVRSAASHLEREHIQDADVLAETEITDECWNRNRPLNMIAYEDQK